MNMRNDEVTAFFQHLDAHDTCKLSAMCSFQEDFEESYLQ
jgi:hypothetical protein